MPDDLEQEPTNKGGRMPGNINMYLVIAVVTLLGGGGANVVTDSLVPKTSPALDAATVQRIIKEARPDPFTGTDAREMQLSILNEMASSKQHTVQLIMRDVCSRLRLLRVEMPPENTRERIRAMEEELRTLAASFKPSTTRWTNIPPPCPQRDF